MTRRVRVDRGCRVHVGGLVIAGAYVVYHFTQPRHGGAYGQGEIVGTIAMVVTFGGSGLYKLLKR